MPGTQQANLVTEVVERLRVLVIAGVTVGVVVAGIGSRLAMLVLRLTSPKRVLGLTSDDGFEIGRFTVSGTYNLLLLGAFVGVLGAATYMAVAPWLLGPVWLRRVTVGAASGAVVGSMLIHADGIDFRVLEPLWLAVVLFIALPACFAIAMSVAVDRMRAPSSWISAGRWSWALPVILLVAFPSALLIAVPAAVFYAIWLPLRHSLADEVVVPTVLGVAIRGVWLAIAVAGLVALVNDIQALA